MDTLTGEEKKKKKSRSERLDRVLLRDVKIGKKKKKMGTCLDFQPVYDNFFYSELEDSSAF